jgi:hypothetical protein
MFHEHSPFGFSDLGGSVRGLGENQILWLLSSDLYSTSKIRIGLIT